MKRFNTWLRRLLFVCLIVLASVGIGLSGGVPIPNMGKREEKQEINNETLDDEGEEGTLPSAELRN